MNLKPLLPIWISLPSIICALFVQNVDTELNLTDISFLPNHTSLSEGISANKPAIFCDGNQYGINLVLTDCKDAVTGIKRSRQLLRFSERSAGPGMYDVGLPFRQIGCEDALEEAYCCQFYLI